MLKKLLKYDLIFIYKALAVLYLIILFFAACTRVLGYFEQIPFWRVVGYFSSGVVITMIFNILINNLMRFWVRFVRDFYGDESYLTHTLPVTKSSLLLSKFLASVITSLTSVGTIALSVLIAYGTKENLMAFKTYMEAIRELLHYSPVLIACAFIVIVLLEVIYLFQLGATGIILGHRMNSGKIGYSVLFAFICHIICNIAIFVVVIGIALLSPSLRSAMFTNAATVPDVSTIHAILIGGLLEYLLLTIILYVLNHKWFCRGVNVN